MPGDNRKKLLDRMRELAGMRVKEWQQFGGGNPPQPSTQEATLETLSLIGLLTDDWNADIHVAHQMFTEETEKLAVATQKLDESTRRLDRVTRVLIGATTVLALGTLWHVSLLIFSSH